MVPSSGQQTQLWTVLTLAPLGWYSREDCPRKVSLSPGPSTTTSSPITVGVVGLRGSPRSSRRGVGGTRASLMTGMWMVLAESIVARPSFSMTAFAPSRSAVALWGKQDKSASQLASLTCHTNRLQCHSKYSGTLFLDCSKIVIQKYISDKHAPPPYKLYSLNMQPEDKRVQIHKLHWCVYYSTTQVMSVYGCILS